MVDRLMGIWSRGERPSDDLSEKLTMQMLKRAFAQRDPMKLPAAAFLAGRCQPDVPALQEELTELLRNLVESLPVDNLGIMDEEYIEAAMSLALRGEPDTARQALVPLVTDYASSTTRSYLAAFYLAQLGDVTGYPAMLAAVRNTSEHTRLMAARHLIGFRPFDGKSIQGNVVDVRAELVRCLKDQDPYVRREIPYLLAEMSAEGLRELLRPVAEGDTDEAVSQAARDVLDHLKDE